MMVSASTTWAGPLPAPTDSMDFEVAISRLAPPTLWTATSVFTNNTIAILVFEGDEAQTYVSGEFVPSPEGSGGLVYSFCVPSNTATVHQSFVDFAHEFPLAGQRVGHGPQHQLAWPRTYDDTAARLDFGRRPVWLFNFCQRPIRSHRHAFAERS
jgi:hypothetical protein